MIIDKIFIDKIFTLPETNIALEPSQKETDIPTQVFQVRC